MPINIPEKWSDVMNRPDYTSGDPTVKLKKQEEWLSKIRTANEGNPDFSESIYEGIKNKVMLKEQPQNQYTQQEPAFDIDTGIKLQPGQDISQVFPEFPIRQELPPEPPPGKKLDTTMLEEMKWTDILSSQFYNAAAPNSKKVIADQWLSYQQSIRSPLVYDGIKKKVYGTLPSEINANPMITEQPNVMAKPVDQTKQSLKKIQTSNILNPLSWGNATPSAIAAGPQIERSQEDIDRINREAYSKTYAPMMATPEEIDTAGLKPNETEKALNIAKPQVRTLEEVQALQDPGFVGSLLNPAEMFAMGGTGAIIAKRFGKPVLATTVDYAFNGAPAIWKGLKGFARGVAYGVKGIENIAKRSNSNPAQVESLIEKVFLEGWDDATFQRAIKDGKFVGDTYLEKSQKYVRDSVNALKKYGAEVGMTEDEINIMMKTGDIPPTQPSIYSVFKPYVKETIQEAAQPSLPGVSEAVAQKQLKLPLRESVPEPIITPGKIPKVPSKEKPIQSGISEVGEVLPSLGHLNPRLDYTSHTYGALLRKWGSKIDTPLRMFEKAGGNLKKEIYDRLDDADMTGLREMVDRFRPKIKEWKGMGIDRKRLATYLIARQEDGKDILTKMGIDWKKSIGKITTEELKVADEMGRYYKELFHRINIARIKSGLQPIGEVENYFTFYRQMDFLDKLGVNTVDALDYTGEVKKVFGHMNSTYFAEGKKRGKDVHIPVELDALASFDRYVGHALTHINLTPEISRSQKILSQIEKTHPEVHENIRSWLHYVAGKSEHNMDDVTRWKLLNTNKRVSTSLLAWNARVATGQVASLQNTYAITNSKHLTKGIGIFMKDVLASTMGKETANRKFVMQNSNLIGRLYDAAENELMDMAEGKMKKYIVKAGMKPMKIVDAVVAEMSWNAFFSHGKALGFKGKDLIRYANDNVVRTQASGRRIHTAPIQRSDWGRWLSMLQTFRINDWGFITQDVLGMGKNVPFTRKNLLKVMRWVIGSEVVTSVFEDVLHTDSPAPHPVRAMIEEANKTDPSFFGMVKAGGREMLETVPFIGTATRFRDAVLNPTVGAAVKLGENIWKGNWWESGMEGFKLTGIPISPFRYAKRAKEYGEGKVKELRGIFYTTQTDIAKKQAKQKKKSKMKPMSGGGDLKPISPPGSKKKKSKISITPLS